MSDTTSTPSLPPLVLFPERSERRESWLDRAATAAIATPVLWRARLGDRELGRLLDCANALESEFRDLDATSLREEIHDIRRGLRRKGFETEVVARAFGLIREVARQQLGLRHYDVQLAGGFAMLKGRVAEMDTGEGKTLTATLAAATAALSGIPVHVVTVNDYLAQRDAENMVPVYEALGLSVGTIVHGIPPESRRAAYACDITYASNKEIAFDYLRDRIALGRTTSNLGLKLKKICGARPGGGTVMRGLCFAIVDEADSVLVDEARTPLIISRQSRPEEERRLAETAFALIEDLEPDVDFRILRAEKRIDLTRQGRERLAVHGEELGGIWQSSVRREEAARQALAARELFHKGDHYLVQDGKVQIVDEYTGRIMADRSWSEGLHQLIELKEGCEVTARKVPVARITYQRFFRRYERLAGMTGTAREVSRELWSVYRLQVTRIPTNKPPRRQRLASRLFQTEEEKWAAIARRAAELQEAGLPLLIGTRSVAASETLSEWLSRDGLEHDVLSAAQDEREAEIIAQAGERGRITVATNMAGRGVDIAVNEQARLAEGLHVILSERHDARRIDRQLEGRCGRQGEPGTVQAFLSLEDPLLDLMPGSLVGAMSRLPVVLGKPASLWLIGRAQRRAERSHYTARRLLLRHDQRLGELLAFSGGTE